MTSTAILAIAAVLLNGSSSFHTVRSSDLSSQYVSPLTLLDDLEYPTGLWIHGDEVYLTESAGRNTVYGGKISLLKYDIKTGRKTVLVNNPLYPEAVVVASNGGFFPTSYQLARPVRKGS